MSLLITDISGGVWHMTDADAQPARIPCPVQAPVAPCARGECMAVACALQRQCLCMRLRDHALISSMPAPPGVCDMCFSPCCRYLYQLSSEADCVHTRCVATGELLFAAPAGVFPRMMRLDAQGRTLLVAGGAVDEVYVLSAPMLHTEAVIHTRSACFAADRWRGGLVLVCASEGDDIHTEVYILGKGKVRPRRLIELPGQPGGLCVCPDGRCALISTCDGLMKMDLQSGRLLWNLTEWPLCMGICCRGAQALISDTLSAQVCLLCHHTPWVRRVVFVGTGTQACFAGHTA